MRLEFAPPKDKKGRRKLWLALAFALVGVAVCGISWKFSKRAYTPARAPEQVLKLIPNIPKEKQESVMRIAGGAFALTAALPPEQRDQIREILKHRPNSIDDLLSQTQAIDNVLTPEQRKRAKPIRKLVQDKIVDEMFEPGRSRFRPDEFDKFKNEIKRRVGERMGTN